MLFHCDVETVKSITLTAHDTWNIINRRARLESVTIIIIILKNNFCLIVDFCDIILQMFSVGRDIFMRLSVKQHQVRIWRG